MVNDDSKFFEAAQALAQSLSQWDLLIIAGSLVVIVSTSYYRPGSRRMRAAYFLFLPAWFFLALSIYQGIEVQRSYVAYLVAVRAKISDRIGPIAQNMNNATQSQIKWLEFGLCVLRYGSSSTLGGGCLLTKPAREDTEGDRNENFSAWVGDLHRGYWLWEANNPKG